MLTELAHVAPDLTAAADVILAGRGGGGGINTNGITNWIARNIVPIILCVIGVMIMASAKRGRISEGANTLTIVLLGLLPIVAAGAFIAFGNDIANVIFG